ncbi:STY0301 family protein [Lysobacter antibioticus]|uniref:STY0301 family protein n=1 Tax=Lysobacter antibioticus TaxID=84531 RepID=UPI003CCCE8FA
MSIYTVVLAAGMQITACPPVIEDVQSIQPVPGWSVSVRKYPRRLDRVMLYTEEPSKRRSVMPVPGKVKGTQTWSFRDMDIWVECEYRDSAAVLTRNLGPVTSCDFTRHQGGLTPPAKLVCEK